MLRPPRRILCTTPGHHARALLFHLRCGFRLGQPERLQRSRKAGDRQVRNLHVADEREEIGLKRRNPLRSVLFVSETERPVCMNLPISLRHKVFFSPQQFTSLKDKVPRLLYLNDRIAPKPISRRFVASGDLKRRIPFPAPPLPSGNRKKPVTTPSATGLSPGLSSWLSRHSHPLLFQSRARLI